MTAPAFSPNKPEIGCFMRLHFWDEGVARALSRLSSAWGGEVGLAADQTRPFAIPVSAPRFDHSRQRFERLGLPLRPTRDSALWHNGDYVLYDLMLRTEYDYIILAEYDLAVNCDLRALAHRAAESGVYLVIDGFMPRQPERWVWARAQADWDAFERPGAPERPVYGSFFPFVLISRRAALWLFARRIVNGRAAERVADPPWPFCESFVPTELAAADFSDRALSEAAPGPILLSDRDFHSWSVAETSDLAFIHPVEMGGRFVERARHCALHDHPGDRAAQLADLRRARGRTRDEAEIAALDAVIAGVEA